MSDGTGEHDDEQLQLDDALKMAGVALTGGHAKRMIQDGEVRVNGEVETRRKRKLIEGDVVEVDGESFEIALSDVDDEDEDEDLEDDEFEGAQQLSATELREWATWVEGRVRDDDLEAVIIRLGSLHPDALEGLFELLPEAVEEAVLEALTDVLGDDGMDSEPPPMQA